MTDPKVGTLAWGGGTSTIHADHDCPLIAPGQATQRATIHPGNALLCPGCAVPEAADDPKVGTASTAPIEALGWVVLVPLLAMTVGPWAALLLAVLIPRRTRAYTRTGMAMFGTIVFILGLLSAVLACIAAILFVSYMWVAFIGAMLFVGIIGVVYSGARELRFWA